MKSAGSFCMTAAIVALFLLALVGHAMLAVRLLNSVHTVALPRWQIKLVSHVIYWYGAGMPVLIAAWAIYYNWQPMGGWPSQDIPLSGLVLGYTAISLLAAALLLPRWLHWRLTWQPPRELLSNHSTCENLAATLGPQAVTAWGSLYCRLPRNEILHLEMSEKVLAPPRWPEELEGFAIAHLSDLHLTGWIDRCYFDEVVRRTNQMQADLTVITGDLVDNNRSIDVVCDVLSRLRASQGVYFVLGNHDRRVDHRRLRQSLVSAGLIDIAGRWTLLEARGPGVIVAGCELPWFSPTPALHEAPITDSRRRRIPRILLAHTPDQIRFAQSRDCDLLLAGHTHGGQIRLPLLGPIVAPSRYGVRYASGVFFEPPTLMHVSRGVSALQLVRFNCPPELAKLVLRCSSRER
jgi:predicted MPP superfamily phosphohydrolase